MSEWILEMCHERCLNASIYGNMRHHDDVIKW